MSKDKEYRILPPEFKRSGWNYSLLSRTGMVAIYEQRDPAYPDKPSGYVVARIVRVPETEFPKNRIMPAREKFPSPSKFGKYGWFYMPKSKNKAFERYREIISRYESAHAPVSGPMGGDGGIAPFEEHKDDGDTEGARA
jgi:hypothetical protein